MIITGLCFLSAGLSIIVAVLVFSAIGVENASGEMIKALTMTMGPGVVNPLLKFKKRSYYLAYFFVVLAVVLFGSGIYYWGQ